MSADCMRCPTSQVTRSFMAFVHSGRPKGTGTWVLASRTSAGWDGPGATAGACSPPAEGGNVSAATGIGRAASAGRLAAATSARRPRKGASGSVAAGGNGLPAPASIAAGRPRPAEASAGAPGERSVGPATTPMPFGSIPSASDPRASTCNSGSAPASDAADAADGAGGLDAGWRARKATTASDAILLGSMICVDSNGLTTVSRMSAANAGVPTAGSSPACILFSSTSLKAPSGIVASGVPVPMSTAACVGLAPCTALMAGPACTAAFTAIPRWSNRIANASANPVPPAALPRRHAGDRRERQLSPGVPPSFPYRSLIVPPRPALPRAASSVRGRPASAAPAWPPALPPSVHAG